VSSLVWVDVYINYELTVEVRMASESLSPSLHWYVIYTNPKQESRAEDNLRAWMIETFTPKIKGRRLNQYTGEASYFVKHLFPRYIFARFRAGDLLHKIRFTRGVHSVLSSGGTPTQVNEKIISIIQSRMDEDGIVQVGKNFKPGDEIIVKEGPLKDFIGIFESEMNDSHRVRVLLTTVNYAAHMVISRDMIEKVRSAEIGIL
jgi:transcriptional antiterminator RfaH